MDHVPRGNPTHCRWRNEAAADWTPWAPYADAHPVGKIPDLCGEHTIHFQVKNDNGESNPVSDTIFYVKNAQQTIPAGCLSDCPCQMSGSGWNGYRIIERTWTWREPDDPITCSNPDGHGNYQTICITVPSAIVYGQKLVLEFFGSRELNEGWSFVALKYRGTEGTYNIRRMPQVGSRDIRFEVSVWSNVGGASVDFYIDGIVVKGPCHKDVNEAFN
jgi:hypothetical protein